MMWAEALVEAAVSFSPVQSLSHQDQLTRLLSETEVQGEPVPEAVGVTPVEPMEVILPLTTLLLLEEAVGEAV